jgi:signal peptidase I
MQELPFLVVAALVLAIVIKAFVVQAFYIPSGSMERTLHGCEGCHGDRVMVNKLSYDIHGIRRGDIVVFDGKDNYPGRVTVTANAGGNPVTRALHRVADWIGLAPEGTDYIKRVIGLPGDTVACCTGGRVTLKPKGSSQTKVLDEPYLYVDQPGYDMSFKPVVVPAGHVFVMGDHRNDSYDSRAAQVGSIPEKDIIGRAFVIIWPPSRWRWLGTPSTFHHLSSAAGGAAPFVASSAVVFGAWRVRRGRRRRARRAARSSSRTTWRRSRHPSRSGSPRVSGRSRRTAPRR